MHEFQTTCVGMVCRFHGPFKADSLQQFTADQLLKLPQVAAVQPRNLDKFLAGVAQHKVTVLAFSSSSKASIPLRRAAQQHKLDVVVGRVHWAAEVTRLMPLLQYHMATMCQGSCCCMANVNVRQSAMLMKSDQHSLS